MTEQEKINGWTFEETVKTAENLMENEQNMFKWDVLRHLRDFAETFKEELEQYRALGTVEELKALKEKSEPKKPIYSDFEDNGNDESIPYKAICPVCGYEFNFGSWNEEENHHCRCGQAIDWQ